MDRNRIRHRPGQSPYTFVVGALALIFHASLSYSQQQASEEVLVDRIVAIVNSNPILHSEIEAKIRSGQTVIVSPLPAPEDASVYQKALQDQINYELILQQVDERELTVDESEIDAEIARFIKSRNLTLDQLQEALAQQGMTYAQYKEDFAAQMIIRKFQGAFILPLVKITDESLKREYLKKVGSTSDNVNVQLRQIYIKIPSGASQAVTEAKRERTREAMEKLKAGMAFSEAAKIYSDLSGASENGGLMPAVQLTDLAEGIREQIAPLGEGEFTQPIETPAGFYIFSVEEKQFAGSSDFSKQRDQLEMELRGRELASQTQRWLKEQRRRSEIRVIAP